MPRRRTASGRGERPTAVDTAIGNASLNAATQTKRTQEQTKKRSGEMRQKTTTRAAYGDVGGGVLVPTVAAVE